MAAGDTAQLVLIGQGSSGEETVSSLFYHQVAGPDTLDSANIVTVIDAFMTAFLAEYAACVGTDWRFVKAVLRGIGGAIVSVVGESFTDTGVPGNASDVAGPFERCVLLKKETGTTGRHGHGRIFMPMPPASAFFTAGVIDPGGPDYAAFQTMAGKVKSGVTIITPNMVWEPVLVNRPFTAFLPITDCLVRDLVGIQRRRRFGIGA